MVGMLKVHAMYGLVSNGQRYDIGNKLDFLKTNIAFALKRPAIKKDLTLYLKELAKTL